MSSHILIDGLPPTEADLRYLALVNYGAYTSFGVEQGAARGLSDHLARLDASAIELFGEAVGEGRLRDLMRSAVVGRDPCWLRVSLFSPEVGPRNPSLYGLPKVMVGVFDPPPPLASSLRLNVQTYAREAPHLKHVATFGLIRARRLARAEGFDDALFADADGLVSEGSLWNIGFVSGDHIVWPQAPMLAGVAQILVRRGLSDVGLSSSIEPVRIDDLDRFDSAFICNSATPACAVTAIADWAFDPRPDLIERLTTAWRFQPLEPI